MGPMSTFTLWAHYLGQVPLNIFETADNPITPEAFHLNYL